MKTKQVVLLVALVAAVLALVGCSTDAEPQECDEECEGTDGCEAVYGDRWNREALCFELNEFAGCLELEQEPSVVFVSLDEDGDCWRGLDGHPVGWQLHDRSPYGCPPDDEDGGDAVCE